MENILNQIIEFLLPQNDSILYIFLFLSAIIENIFPPIPGDTITAFGAFLVGTGRLNYCIVYLVTTLGSVIGFMSLFFGARAMERKFFIERDYKFFSAKDIVKAENWFKKWGYGIVLANRFFPGIRSVISIVSGISELKPIRVFFLSLISAGIWNFIWIHTGYTLGNNWDVVKARMGEIISKYNIIVAIIMAVMVIAFIVFKVIKKRLNK